LGKVTARERGEALVDHCRAHGNKAGRHPRGEVRDSLVKGQGSSAPAPDQLNHVSWVDRVGQDPLSAQRDPRDGYGTFPDRLFGVGRGVHKANLTQQAVLQ